MTHDIHGYIQIIGQLGMIAAIFIGIPLCVWMTIKEHAEQINQTHAQLHQPPANPTGASDARYDATTGSRHAQRGQTTRPNTPTKPSRKH